MGVTFTVYEDNANIDRAWPSAPASCRPRCWPSRSTSGPMCVLEDNLRVPLTTPESQALESGRNSKGSHMLASTPRTTTSTGSGPATARSHKRPSRTNKSPGSTRE